MVVKDFFFVRDNEIYHYPSTTRQSSSGNFFCVTTLVIGGTELGKLVDSNPFRKRVNRTLF